MGESATDVDVTWNGQWKVTLEPVIADSTRCAIIANLPVFNNPPQNANGQSLAFGLGCSGQPAAGDGGALVDVEISNAGDNSYTIGHVLYRAGALIALDANAHTFLPSLPNPSAHELEIARQLGFKD